MVFERKQITNLLKQTGRMEAQKKILGNKKKKGSEPDPDTGEMKFETPAKHLMKALGGNMTDPKCATDNTTRTAKEGMGFYDTLMGCSKSISASCDIGDTIDDAKVEDCITTYKAIKESSKACINNTKEDAAAACECWKGVTAEIAAGKEKGCTTVSAMARATNQKKTKCIDAFKDCKKAEDGAIPNISDCGSGEVDYMSHDDA